MERRSHEWLERLEAQGVPHGNIKSYEDAFAHPQAIHRQMRVAKLSPAGQSVLGVANLAQFSGTPVRYPSSAPKLDLHNGEISSRFSLPPGI